MHTFNPPGDTLLLQAMYKAAKLAPGEENVF